MTNDTLEKLIWVLIYGGLFIVCLGLFVRRGDLSLGWILIAAGAVISVLGALLVYLRSRRP